MAENVLNQQERIAQARIDWLDAKQSTREHKLALSAAEFDLNVAEGREEKALNQYLSQLEVLAAEVKWM